MRKGYPKYKDSGIEWLGEIPVHWDCQPLKYMTRFVNGAPFKPVDWKSNGIPIIRIENLNGGDNFNYIIDTVDNKYHVHKGDLLFGWSGNRGTSFGPFLWTRDGLHYLNQHIFNFKGFKCDKAWFYWTLKGVTFYVEKQAHGIIGMVHITGDELGKIKLPVLAIGEQIAIASFLDKQTTKVDTLIAKKEKQIELLKEKRAAVITRAVTKGLDANVPMKDSGIEWLGEIPEHWNMKRLKYVASINTHSLSEDTDPNFIMQYVDIGNVDSIGNIDKGEELRFDGAPSRARRIVTQGDTILSTVRTYLKAIAFVNTQIDNLVVSTGFAVIHANNDLVPKYLFYVLRSEMFVDAVVANSEGVGYPAITPSKLVCLPIWAPDTSEQQQLIEFIDQETSKIDKVIIKIQSSIDKLNEYRTALISAAVTGKIDVRGG